MSDNDRRRRYHAALAARQRALATQFRAELPALREQLFAAEAAGLATEAQGLRNRIVYRERVIARQDGNA